MKKLYPFKLLFALTASALVSCSKSGFDPQTGDSSYDFGTLSHGEIVLGDQLENPYSVENVKNAIAALYPSKAGTDLTPTDLYVRFLPADNEQLSLLRSLDLLLVDHPVDYEIVQDGDWYHDPGVGENAITWQYAVVPAGFSFPSGIKYELLQRCYISGTSGSKSLPGIDWEAVECKAFELTGNQDLLKMETKGGNVVPSGRITIQDPEADGGQPVGVGGVQVSCNVFVKFSSAYTDEDGYYNIPKKFTANPRYRLVFKNEKGFSIGFNSILYPASVSTLGTGSPGGVSVNVTTDSDRKLFRRCVVNNAARDFYRRCSVGDLNISEPPADLCFWMFDNFDSSSAIMLHHGTVMDTESSNAIFKAISWVVCFFAPDITLGTENCRSYKEIYSLVNHEMAHACHFSKVGKDWWDAYIMYIAKNYLDGRDVYGDATLENSGICAVGEMWAYYLESKMYKARYGGTDPAFGSTYWFHPQILTSIEDRGISTSDILSAYDAGITDKNALRDRLVELFPAKRNSILQIFNRYD